MKIGLALSGGGVRGFAHAGVLQALEENNIRIHAISGTSSGSIVATLYAMGASPHYMYILAKKYAKKVLNNGNVPLIPEIGNFVINKKIRIKGLNSGDGIEEFFNAFANKRGIRKFQDIHMPVVITAVDIQNAKKYIFASELPQNERECFLTNIPVGTAVKASCSFPVFFAPCEYENHVFMDGGILTNTPAVELKKYGIDKIISIAFDNGEIDDKSTLMDVSMKALDVMVNKMAEKDFEVSDLVLKVPTDGTGFLDTEHIDVCYKMGYNTIVNNIDKIRALLSE